MKSSEYTTKVHKTSTNGSKSLGCLHKFLLFLIYLPLGNLAEYILAKG
jgi:hypothetical protein